MSQPPKLVLDSATRDGSGKMTQVPCEKILGAADRGDRNVQRIIRNGRGYETSSKQDCRERVDSFRDLQEFAVGNGGQALGSHLGIASAGFAHYDRGGDETVLLALTFHHVLVRR